MSVSNQFGTWHYFDLNHSSPAALWPDNQIWHPLNIPNPWIELSLCPVFFVVTCAIHSSISGEKNSSISFIQYQPISLLPSVSRGKYSGSFELVTVELSVQSSLQSTFSCIDRIFITSRFCHCFMLLDAKSRTCSCEEIRAERRESLSYLCTSTYQRGKLPCEKQPSSLKLCKIILLRVTSISFTWLCWVDSLGVQWSWWRGGTKPVLPLLFCVIHLTPYSKGKCIFNFN